MRWVIIRAAPAPKLCHKSPIGGSRFQDICAFVGKNDKVLNLHNYINFYQDCSKSRFYSPKSHFVTFFTKHFSDFDQNSNRAVLGIHNCIFFGKKRCIFEFTLLHVLSELFIESIFRFEIPYCFFLENRRKIRRFFADLEFWLKSKKNLRVLPYVLQKKWNKFWFQVVKSTFWTILVKHA